MRARVGPTTRACRGAAGWAAGCMSHSRHRITSQRSPVHAGRPPPVQHLNSSSAQARSPSSRMQALYISQPPLWAVTLGAAVALGAATRRLPAAGALLGAAAAVALRVWLPAVALRGAVNLTDSMGGFLLAFAVAGAGPPWLAAAPAASTSSAATSRDQCTLGCAI